MAADVPAGAPTARDRRQRVQQCIDEQDGADSRLRGWRGVVTIALLVAMSLFHLYAALAPVPAQILRPVHVGFTLLLVFLLFPVAARYRNNLMWWDIVCALLGVASIAYLIAGGSAIWGRSTLPIRSDVFFGVAFVMLVLEACRRVSGWTTPVAAGLFLGYGLAGPWLPGSWRHPGYDVPGMTGFLYQTLDGIFGAAVGASSSLIILFTIFGAFLSHAGAGKSSVDWSVALAGRGRVGAGGAVVVASVLIGGSSGSSVASTVAIGSAAYPMLERAGYGKNAAGGLLAASGLGAVIAPPVLGAAAFVMGGFLGIGYLDLLVMSAIPALLIYLSMLLAVEIDARKLAARDGTAKSSPVAAALTRRCGIHLVSLASVVAFVTLGIPPIPALLCAIAVACVASFLRRDTMIGPAKLVLALRDGSRRALHAAATCAAVGIIAGIAAKTGLGPKFGDLLISSAGGAVWLTALFTAVIVWIVGLVVPVIATYVIGAVLAAPALVKLGVPDYAAHFFVFYFAVLAEVSPLTARSSCAAAVIAGGDRWRSALHSWKYALALFTVPFAFVLDRGGVVLLLQVPANASWPEAAWSAMSLIVGTAALAAGAQKWLLRACSETERWILAGCGLLLVCPSFAAKGVGLAGLLCLTIWQRVRVVPADHARG